MGKPFAQGVKGILGGHVTVQIAKRNELHTHQGDAPALDGERSLAWLEKNRRLRKSCELLINTIVQFVHLAFPALLLQGF